LSTSYIDVHLNVGSRGILNIIITHQKTYASAGVHIMIVKLLTNLKTTPIIRAVVHVSRNTVHL